MSSTTNTLNNLHAWHHDDYDLAKQHIFDQLGSLDGLEIFGRQVLVGVYVRPAMNPRNGWTVIESRQQEDWYQGKVALIIALGPDAFVGDESYRKANFPDGIAPKVGDWMFMNASTGMQMNMCGDGAVRVQYEDRHGDMQNMYPNDGWPIRTLLDDGFLGRLTKPHHIV